jgi:methylaspartate mutase epsilon subunit
MAAPEVSNAKWSLDQLHEKRREVFAVQLEREPYDLDEAVAYAERNARRGTVSGVLAAAKESGKTVCVPRAGVASWEGQRQLMQALDEAGAAFLPMTIDSLTRELRFAEAAAMLASSSDTVSSLNGYPIVAHGIEATRRLVETFDKPVIIRANAVDLRICAETGFASGGTAFVSGPMYATIEYSKNVALAESIPYWQYIFRLMGSYTDAGIPVADDAVGFAQSGTCSVPALMHVGVVLDALIMAGQGVRHIMPYSMLQGAIAQDVASCIAVEILVQEYLGRCGYQGVSTYVASSDWNGAFPSATPDAYGLIAANVFAAAIARPPLNYVKTIHEGLGVPTAQANAQSVRISRYLFHLIGRQADTLRSAEVEFELALNLMEARSILDAVLDSGDGDPALGACRALESGILDIPFSPNVHVQGNVLPIRDGNGAVRFLDCGRLPIPAEARAMEAERLSLRSPDPSALSYQDVIDDLEFLELDAAAPSATRQAHHA